MYESQSVLYMCMLSVCNLTSTDNVWITVCILYTYATSVEPHSDRQCRNHCLYFICVCYQCVTPHPPTMQESLYVLYIRMLHVCNHTATDNIWITVCTLYTYATSVEPHSDRQCRNHSLYFIYVCYQFVTTQRQTIYESLSVLYIRMLPVWNHTATYNVWITVCTLYTNATSV